MKSRNELVAWMWKVYPDVPMSKKKDHENYLRRSAMLEAYDFLSGKVDADEKTRKQIAQNIFNKITAQDEKQGTQT